MPDLMPPCNPTRPASRSGVHAALCAVLAAIAAALPLAACRSEPAKARDVRPPVIRDVPSILRGTVGAETTFRGFDPVLVSGFGLVVGVNGTGGGPLPDRVAATMERQLGLMGVGKGGMFDGTALEGLTPRQLLRDPNVAVVVVQAAVPPGAPQGYTFDVYVEPVTPDAASSLEGGTLWTTDLHIGPPQPFGGYATKRLAQARGPIFINPFADPAEVSRRLRAGGRVLAGGVVTSPLEIEIVLDNPSHSRARQITSAINSRFPPGPGDDAPPARGRSGGDPDTAREGSIALRIPVRFRDRPAEFLNLVKFLQIDQRLSEEYARRYAAALLEQPWLAEELSWCLASLGRPSLEFVRALYDSPEPAPRLAALRAGAKLGDARAAAPLKDIALSPDTPGRLEAIALLGDLDAGPTVDLALHQVLADDHLDARIAAYEALARRAERAQLLRLAQRDRALPRDAADFTAYDSLERLSRVALPAGTIQAVERVPAGSFFLDIVPFGDPLIYVTQQGIPRIVLFGKDLRVRGPALVSAWADRLMLDADADDASPLRVYYRDYRTGSVTQQEVPRDLVEFILFMAHQPTPERPAPGLALSYSEVVGALHAIHAAGAVPAAFSTESDRLVAGILGASRRAQVEERPETSADAPPPDDALDRPGLPPADAPAPAPGDHAPPPDSPDSEPPAAP